MFLKMYLRLKNFSILLIFIYLNNTDVKDIFCLLLFAFFTIFAAGLLKSESFTRI